MNKLNRNRLIITLVAILFFLVIILFSLDILKLRTLLIVLDIILFFLVIHLWKYFLTDSDKYSSVYKARYISLVFAAIFLLIAIITL